MDVNMCSRSYCECVMKSKGEEKAVEKEEERTIRGGMDELVNINTFLEMPGPLKQKVSIESTFKVRE